MARRGRLTKVKCNAFGGDSLASFQISSERCRSSSSESEIDVSFEAGYLASSGISGEERSKGVSAPLLFFLNKKIIEQVQSTTQERSRKKRSLRKFQSASKGRLHDAPVVRAQFFEKTCSRTNRDRKHLSSLSIFKVSSRSRKAGIVCHTDNAELSRSTTGGRKCQMCG